MIKTKEGFATIIIFLTVLSALMTLVIALGVLALNDIKIARNLRFSENAFAGAESGIEDSLIRLLTGKNLPASYNINLNNVQVAVDNSGLGTSNTIIKASGDENNRIRKIKVNLALDSTNVNFQFAVQAGNGGFFLKNSSIVNGTVFSNGDIDGENTAQVTGGAWAANGSHIDSLRVGQDARAREVTNGQITGNVFASYLANNNTVGGDTRADIIRNSDITGDVYYQTELSGTTVGGNIFSGITPPVDVALADYPISNDELNVWQNDAAAGGEINCPGGPNDDFEPANGAIIGPVKINCNLLVDGTKQLIVQGAVWVVGNISLKNSAILRLDPSFGSDSGVIIAFDPGNSLTRGLIEVANSAQVLGSGTAGSYVLAVSRNNDGENGGSIKAVKIANSSSSSIYFAPQGIVEISNNVNLKETTAWRIELQNSAQLIYESGLASVNFVSDTGAGLKIVGYAEE